MPANTNSNAFTQEINPIGSGQDEQNLVHQVSPTWVVTFVRWSIQDTLRTKPTPTNNFQTVRPRDPLVVENDCVNVSVVVDKGTLTDNAAATFKITDVNYETAVHPGDFMIINMLNWEEDSRRVALAALAKTPINGINDGFKGVFKVQGVRKILGVDPETGKKAWYVKVTGFSFTEFNNIIYFNPELIFSNEKNDLLLFVSNIANSWKILQNDKGVTNIQDIVEALIDSFIGTGIGNAGKTVKGQLLKSPNTLFYVPALLGTLLGNSHAKAAKDIYNFMFGIQNYAGGPGQTLVTGMNPNGFVSNNGRVWKPGDKSAKVQGETVTKPEYWNQVKIWSIFNQFSNAPLNEMFSCFRVSPDGNVMPTMVFRQIPFTNDDFVAGNSKVTRFMNLPRWKIHPALVTQFDIGRDESARINFMQYFGRSTLGPEGWDISSEIARGNYLYDIDDVKRNGLKPYIVTSSFDELTTNKNIVKSPIWAKIVGDALIGGQLKFNGSIETAGIVDPIAVGDNLEFDGVVYHIERVSHTAGIDPETGKKIFRTSFGLSMGLSVDSNAKGVRYAEMTYGNAYALRKQDGADDGNQILPGISESQDTVYRQGAPEALDYRFQEKPPSDGFKQPNNNTSVRKTGVENQLKENHKNKTPTKGKKR